MTVGDGRPSILLIDDREELLRPLGERLRAELAQEADVREWAPSAEDGSDGMAALASRVDDATSLVVTDYVLSEGGMLGMGGPMIVNWCQARAIPVCNFSRVDPDDRPPEASLFQWRVPPGQEQTTAAFIVALHRGFADISAKLRGLNDLDSLSASSALAAVLGRSHLDPSISFYLTKLATTNPHLAKHLRSKSHNNAPPLAAGRVQLLAYLLGHVLGNVILRFPGPILPVPILAAYVGAPASEGGDLQELFDAARYDGPFQGHGPFFWREDVDRILDTAGTPPSDVDRDFDQANRMAAEALLGRPLARHGCGRCDGMRGGFWCPLTERPVCVRPDCSVASDTWLPEGADRCRIERDFYDEEGPFLKL